MILTVPAFQRHHLSQGTLRTPQNTPKTSYDHIKLLIYASPTLAIRLDIALPR